MSVLETYINGLPQTERDVYDETCQAIIKLEASLKKNIEELSLIEAQKKLIGPHVDFLKKRLQALYEQRAKVELKALNVDKKFNTDISVGPASAGPCRSTASAG